MILEIIVISAIGAIFLMYAHEIDQLKEKNQLCDNAFKELAALHRIAMNKTMPELEEQNKKLTHHLEVYKQYIIDIGGDVKQLI